MGRLYINRAADWAAAMANLRRKVTGHTKGAKWLRQSQSSNLRLLRTSAVVTRYSSERRLLRGTLSVSHPQTEQMASVAAGVYARTF